MAALTATSIVNMIVGNKFQALAQIPAASDGDTWDASAAAGIKAIDFAMSCPNDAATVAADSNSITWSGSTVTFHVAGTARAQCVMVWGKRHPV